MDKVWISKYALSKGLFELEVEIHDNMASGKAWSDCYHGEGREWHRTYESAAAKAEQMRLKKIESLKKQIEKLEQKRFV